MGVSLRFEAPRGTSEVPPVAPGWSECDAFNGFAECTVPDDAEVAELNPEEGVGAEGAEGAEEVRRRTKSSSRAVGIARPEPDAKDLREAPRRCIASYGEQKLLPVQTKGGKTSSLNHAF